LLDRSELGGENSGEDENSFGGEAIYNFLALLDEQGRDEVRANHIVTFCGGGGQLLQVFARN